MKHVKEWLSRHWLAVLAIAMLVGTLVPFPYAYYQLLNWVVVGASIVIALRAKKERKEFFFWLFIALAVVFNPVAPLHLRSDLWQATDVIAALLFIMSFFIV